jgi:hypothetical protein
MPMAAQDTAVMSPEASAMAFAAAARQALTSEDHASISDAALEAVMTAAVKLYAARADLRRELPPPLSEREVSPTEVVVVASEMIRVVDLNPFDLSMWYRRAR